MEVITQKPPKRKRKTNHQTVENPPKNKSGCSHFVGFILVFGLFASLYLLSQSSIEQPTEPTIRTDKPKKKNSLLFEDVIRRNPDGSYDLQPKRKAKLHRDTSNLENSEQYALRAVKSQFYPCLSCPFRDSIFLYRDEIWKYGTTINGQKGRYGNSLHSQFLNYELQFRGTISECLKQERIKIISYPMLPENLKRQYPIARPPGNPNDN